MTDADALFAASTALRQEAEDQHKSLVAQWQSGALNSLEALAAALVDQASLTADIATQHAELLSPEAAAADQADDDDDEDDEDYDDPPAGLEPEEAELFRRLLGGYSVVIKSMLANLPEEHEQRAVMVKDLADCERALSIVHDLELVDGPDDPDEPPIPTQ